MQIKKQNVYTKAKNWWKNQKVKSVIKDINNIKEPAKLDAKIEELSKEKFFDKVSEAQANEGLIRFQEYVKESNDFDLITRVTGGQTLDIIANNHNISTDYLQLLNNRNEIPISNELMLLITRFQDTVHDTAISYHRKLRDESITKSELDDIKGIGEIKKKALVKYFGSVIKDINKIKEPAKLDAKIEELANEEFFDKVSEAQANEVRSAIRKRQAEIETSGIKEANEN